MKYAILAILLLSSCSGQPAPQPGAPVAKGGDASAGTNGNGVAKLSPNSNSTSAVPGVSASGQNTPVTLSVLIGPIIHFVQRPGEQIIGRDYVEGSTKQWAIRALPWPCEQPPEPFQHVILEATEQPDKTWVATKCIGDNYDAPFPAEWEQL